MFLAILASYGAVGWRWKGLLDVPLGKTFLVRNKGRSFWWTQEFLAELCSCLSGVVGKSCLGIPEPDNNFCDNVSNLSRVRAEMGLRY